MDRLNINISDGKMKYQIYDSKQTITTIENDIMIIKEIDIFGNESILSKWKRYNENHENNEKIVRDALYFYMSFYTYDNEIEHKEHEKFKEKLF
jgi:hypothetical protein